MSDSSPVGTLLSMGRRISGRRAYGPETRTPDSRCATTFGAGFSARDTEQEKIALRRMDAFIGFARSGVCHRSRTDLLHLLEKMRWRAACMSARIIHSWGPSSVANS